MTDVTDKPVVADDPNRTPPPYLATPPPSQPTPEQMIYLAIQQNASIEALERLYQVLKDANRDRQRSAFFAAFAAFQAEMPVIKKNKTAYVRSERTGQDFTYDYADLADIQKAIAPVMGKHGLSYSFDARYGENPGQDRLACIVAHRDGWERPTEVKLVVDPGARMNAIQAGGSSLTFAKRYALCNALGIAPDQDTDGKDANYGPPVIRPGDYDDHGYGGSQYDPDVAASHPAAYAGQAQQKAQAPKPPTAPPKPPREDLGACPDCGVIGSLGRKRNGNVFCKSATGGCGHEFTPEQFQEKRARAQDAQDAQDRAIHEGFERAEEERERQESMEALIRDAEPEK